MEIGPASRIAFGRMVRKVLVRRHADYDGVLVQNYGLASLGANLAFRQTKKPTWMHILSPTELYYRCRKGRSYPGKPFRWHEYAALKFVASINARLNGKYVVVSDHVADLVRNHGPSVRAVVNAFYGVDIRFYKPSENVSSEAKMRLRKSRGLPEHGKVIFFSSRISPEKDAEAMLQAFEFLVAKGKDVYLLNRSGDFQQLSTMAKKRGLGTRVIATQAVHPHLELPYDYQASDVCVQASREEGLGLAPLEALACGTPAVAAAVGGLRETIRDGETGWTYAPGDARGLATAIEAVLADPIEAARRTAIGRRMVVERYSSQLCFDQLKALMEES